MFDWRMFLVLVIICAPGVRIAMPGTLKVIVKLAQDRIPPGKTMPPMPVLAITSTIQSLAILAVPATVGAIVTPRVGLRAPFFEALLDGAPLLEVL